MRKLVDEHAYAGIVTLVAQRGQILDVDAVGRAQVPLAAVGAARPHAGGSGRVQRVVGRGDDALAAVGHGVGHLGVGGKLACQGGGI